MKDYVGEGFSLIMKGLKSQSFSLKQLETIIRMSAELQRITQMKIDSNTEITS